nr:MerR family transcriptional regulator [Burkholderia metallica]
MNDVTRGLSASEAAARLGVSVKALRLYERQGLVTPARTVAGYRAYQAVEKRLVLITRSLRKRISYAIGC